MVIDGCVGDGSLSSWWALQLTFQGFARVESCGRN